MIQRETENIVNIGCDTHGAVAGNGRNHVLDAVRGLAVLAVITDHCHLSLPSVPDYLEVPAFFIVAGILLKPAVSFIAFLKKKALRLMPPYFFYAILFILLVFPLSHIGIDAKDLALGIIQPANAPLWFLKALLWAFIGWRTFMAVAGERNAVRTMFALFSLAAGIAMGIYCGSLPEWFLMTGIGQGLVAMPLLWLGYLSCRIFTLPVGHRMKSFAGGALLLAGALLLVHGPIHMHRCDIGNPLTFYPFAAVVFTAVYLLLAGIGRLKPLEFLGRVSLPLFCVHAIAITLLECAGIENRWLLFAATLVSSTAFCVLLTSIPWAKRLKIV